MLLDGGQRVMRCTFDKNSNQIVCIVYKVKGDTVKKEAFIRAERVDGGFRIVDRILPENKSLQKKILKLYEDHVKDVLSGETNEADLTKSYPV